MPDDLQLLREFAERHSEAAFAELVQRHLGLVYSAAFRQTRDAHLAEEITQSVFTLLARKAGLLGPKTILAVWLLRASRYLAADTLKAQRRRQIREHQAYMQASQSAAGDGGAPELDAVWGQLSPLLDDALAQLAEADRAALVLRYFQDKPVREIAAALRIGEAAAHKRLARALDKLRTLLTRRGVHLSATALSTAIAAYSVATPPAGLAATIANSAPAAHLLSLKTALAMTTIQKTAISAALATAVLLAVYEARQAMDARTAAHDLRAQQTALLSRLQDLQGQYQQATNLLAGTQEEAARNRAEVSELLRLRGEVGQLRRETLALRSAKTTAKQAVTDPATPPIPYLNHSWIVSDSDSDDYKLQLAKMATGERNRYTGDARNLSYAVREYARDHAGQMPADFDQVAPYKWSGELPLAGSFKERDTMAGANDFEIVYHGSLNDLTNVPDGPVALLRQREPWATPAGKWARIYTMSDSRVFVVESDSNFGAWEAAHTRR